MHSEKKKAFWLMTGTLLLASIFSLGNTKAQENELGKQLYQE